MTLLDTHPWYAVMFSGAAVVTVVCSLLWLAGHRLRRRRDSLDPGNPRMGFGDVLAAGSRAGVEAGAAAVIFSAGMGAALHGTTAHDVVVERPAPSSAPEPTSAPAPGPEESPDPFATDIADGAAVGSGQDPADPFAGDLSGETPDW